MRVRLESDNQIKAYGPRHVLAKWTPKLREYKRELIEELSPDRSEAIKNLRPPLSFVGGLKLTPPPQKRGGLNDFGGLNPVMAAVSRAEPSTSVASLEGRRTSVDWLLDAMAAENERRRDWTTPPVDGWREGRLELRSAATVEATVIHLSNWRVRT